MVSKKYAWKNIVSTNQKILLPLAIIKDSLKIYFHEMEKLLPVEGLFEKLEENGVHWPEN